MLGLGTGVTDNSDRHSGGLGSWDCDGHPNQYLPPPLLSGGEGVGLELSFVDVIGTWQ
jgi:hypothetical protein